MIVICNYMGYSQLFLVLVEDASNRLCTWMIGQDFRLFACVWSCVATVDSLENIAGISVHLLWSPLQSQFGLDIMRVSLHLCLQEFIQTATCWGIEFLEICRIRSCGDPTSILQVPQHRPVCLVPEWKVCVLSCYSVCHEPISLCFGLCSGAQS